MEILSVILTVLGLCVFEIVNSIDNAVINAQILSTMQQKYRRWFLFFGIFIAVFLVRGALPWAIVFAANPSIGFKQSFAAFLSGNTQAMQSIQMSAPILLAGAATFLLLLLESICGFSCS